MEKFDISDEQNRMFYQAARAEVVQRLSLRDQSLVAYVVAAGAYLGFIVQPQLKPTAQTDEIIAGSAIVIVLPILSLLFTYVILQHHIVIGRLGEYARQLYPTSFNSWDNFYASWKDRSYLTARTMSQALLLIMPIGYTGVFILRDFHTIVSSSLLILTVSCVISLDVFVVALIIRLHVRAYLIRRRTDYPSNRIPSE
jgi:hypothetical protein